MVEPFCEIRVAALLAKPLVQPVGDGVAVFADQGGDIADPESKTGDRECGELNSSLNLRIGTKPRCQVITGVTRDRFESKREFTEFELGTFLGQRFAVKSRCVRMATKIRDLVWVPGPTFLTIFLRFVGRWCHGQPSIHKSLNRWAWHPNDTTGACRPPPKFCHREHRSTHSPCHII